MVPLIGVEIKISSMVILGKVLFLLFFFLFVILRYILVVGFLRSGFSRIHHAIYFGGIWSIPPVPFACLEDLGWGRREWLEEF